MAEGAPQENNSIEMKVPLFEPEFLRGRTIETTPTNLDEKWFEFLRDIRRTTMKLRRRTDIMKIKAKTKKKEEKITQIFNLAEELDSRIYSKQKQMVEFRENHCLPLPVVHIVQVSKDFLKKDQTYSPNKRKLRTPLERIYLEPKFRTENLIFIDVRQLVQENDGQDLGVFGQELPVYAMGEDSAGEMMITARFKLSERASKRLLMRDPKGRLRAAIKIACANYTYWQEVLSRLKMLRSKGPDERRLQQSVRQYLHNPLACKAVVYLYEVMCSSLPHQEKSQLFIGQTTKKNLGTHIKEHQNDNDEPSLFEMFLQKKEIWPTEPVKLVDQNGKVFDYEPNVIVLALDYGVRETPPNQINNLDGFLTDMDTLDKLQRDYVNYFGTKSPIGLNAKLPGIEAQ